ncbi:MAG: SufD family Fe-S cluster assembly protein [Xanthomonadales bacterium]|nr:SufD family Fe-S cluster assembly protein [Xanthomonadales bacterium]
MAGSVMLLNLIDTAFQKLTKSLSEPDWLQEKRQKAFENFQKTGLPNRKSELWKYTNVRKLEQLPELQTQFHSNFFEITGDSQIEVKNLKDLNSKHWQEIQTDFDRVFVELNTAMLNDGFHIVIPANTKVKLKIDYHQTSKNWQNIRSQIVVEENASLELQENYSANCLMNHVAVLYVGINATVNINSKKHLAENSALLHYSVINCQENAEVKQSHVNHNGGLSHFIQDVNFNGEYGRFYSASANTTNGSTEINDNILVNHLVGNCKSEIIKRSIASDKSQVSVNAKAIVAKGADGSEISQSLKNILLSDTANIYSRPELEINTDDVIAAHGSTVGQLNEVSLNYLRSRGIPKLEAQKILIESFLQEANIFEADNFLNQIEIV